MIKPLLSKGFIYITVGTTRFELATPRPPAWCATGLRYVPKCTLQTSRKVKIFTSQDKPPFSQDPRHIALPFIELHPKIVQILPLKYLDCKCSRNFQL
jgi:hypothetical protein